MTATSMIMRNSSFNIPPPLPVRVNFHMDKKEEISMQARTRIIDNAVDVGMVAAFHRRYKRLFVGAEMVKALLDLAAGWETDQHRAVDIFQQKRQKWEQGGGYIENVSLEDVLGWLASGSYLIAEVAAPDASEDGKFIAVAQRMLRIPSDGWAMPLLQEPADEIVDRARYQSLLGGGWKAAALADFWGVLPEWNGKGLAAEARYTGMQALIERNKSRPEDERLSSVVGMAFAVQGLDVLDGEGKKTVTRAIRLDEFGLSEVANQSSLRGNAMSRRTPAYILGKHRPVSGIPVLVDGIWYSLRVDWYCYIHFLDEVEMPS
ncbi:MAG TPA: hypothetical protein VK802_10615 [Streptosporangiaceae bacterium]|nr:hypothetical protein [Streptosporangiaceae bacterium]